MKIIRLHEVDLETANSLLATGRYIFVEVCKRVDPIENVSTLMYSMGQIQEDETVSSNTEELVKASTFEASKQVSEEVVDGIAVSEASAVAEMVKSVESEDTIETVKTVVPKTEVKKSFISRLFPFIRKSE